MTRIVCAFALVATAAVGAAPPSPRAAPQLQSARCTPGSVQQVHYRLTVAGRLPRSKNALVRRGDWIHTDPTGAADLCLQGGRVTCRVWPDSFIQVLPPKAAGVLLRAGGRGTVSCSATAGARSKQIVTGGQTITLGDLDASRTPAGAQAASTGNLFSITVRRGLTTVKVRRGATIVARRGTLRSAVVLGRDQQVATAKGHAPGDPTAVKLTAAEARVLNRLERRLPKDTDKTPPSGGAEGPAPFSSLRSPSFRFVRNEAGTTFSCALDNSPEFRVCTDGERFLHLAPGPHSLRVKATDRSGNSQLVATYDWTIDDSLIVYTSDRNGDGNTDIYVMDSDGLHQKPLTTGPAQDEDPEWSPDRKHIAFHTRRDGNLEIYVMNADGSAPKRLTNNPAPDTNPTWSPDGRRIAFESSRDLNREIYVMNADGTGQATRLTNNPAQDFDPSWSPDGSQIAFASDRDRNREIYVMNADGSGPARLTNDPATDYGPSWSPDGTRIAFHSNRIRGDDKYDVYYVDADGGDEFRVTQIPGNHFVPDW
jgi:Tol biopolymer transport system component